MAKEGTPVIGKDSRWRMIDVATEQQVKVGDQFTTFRGESYTVSGGAYPHKSGSTGRVYCRRTGGKDIMDSEFYPSVLGLKWVWGV